MGWKKCRWRRERLEAAAFTPAACRSASPSEFPAAADGAMSPRLTSWEGASSMLLLFLPTHAATLLKAVVESVSDTATLRHVAVVVIVESVTNLVLKKWMRSWVSTNIHKTLTRMSCFSYSVFSHYLLDNCCGFCDLRKKLWYSLSGGYQIKCQNCPDTLKTEHFLFPEVTFTFLQTKHLPSWTPGSV